MEVVLLENIKNLGKNCFHIFDNTKEDGIKYRDGLKNIEFVSNIREANFILACTPYKNSLPIDYIPILNEAYKNKMLMFCANPDFETVVKVNKKNITLIEMAVRSFFVIHKSL